MHATAQCDSCYRQGGMHDPRHSFNAIEKPPDERSGDFKCALAVKDELYFIVIYSYNTPRSHWDAARSVLERINKQTKCANWKLDESDGTFSYHLSAKYATLPSSMLEGLVEQLYTQGMKDSTPWLPCLYAVATSDDVENAWSACSTESDDKVVQGRRVLAVIRNVMRRFCTETTLLTGKGACVGRAPGSIPVRCCSVAAMRWREAEGRVRTAAQVIVKVANKIRLICITCPVEYCGGNVPANRRADAVRLFTRINTHRKNQPAFFDMDMNDGEARVMLMIPYEKFEGNLAQSVEGTVSCGLARVVAMYGQYREAVRSVVERGTSGDRVSLR